VVFDHRVIHWGSRGNPHTEEGPRMAISFVASDPAFERAYLVGDEKDEEEEEEVRAPPFEVRLGLACAQMLIYYQRFDLPRTALRAFYEYCREHWDRFDAEYRKKVTVEFVRAMGETDDEKKGADTDEEEDDDDAVLDAMAEADADGYADFHDDFEDMDDDDEADISNGTDDNDEEDDDDDDDESDCDPSSWIGKAETGRTEETGSPPPTKRQKIGTDDNDEEDDDDDDDESDCDPSSWIGRAETGPTEETGSPPPTKRKKM